MSKTKTTSLRLEVNYVVKLEADPQLGLPENTMPAKRSELVPTGDQHIFEKLGTTLNVLSFCGLTRDQIGNSTEQSADKFKGINACETCLKNWKKHPRSEFAKWMKSLSQTP